MSFQPKVSIVIPVYNGSDFLSEAIESALSQRYGHVEIIVVNDGSDDGGATARVARAYGDRVRYFEKDNGGVASALNAAVEHMSGEYFSWLSHDDLYTEDKVAREIEVLAGLDKERTIIYSDYSVFSADPGQAVPVRMRGVPAEQFRYWITVENCLHGCTLLIPRRAFAECGGFDERLRTTQDYDLWFRLAERFRFVHVPEVLVKARSHPEQGSIRMAATALRECNALLSGFVRNLTQNELSLASGQPFAVGYAEIASSMWSRGFEQAGWTAARLAIRGLGRGSLADRSRAARRLFGGAVRYLTVRPARPLVPAGVRRRFKAWAQDALRRARKGGADGRLDLKQKFSAIYEGNVFGGRVSRSGEGSDLVQTAAIRRELPKLLRTLGAKTVLDAPCGDWCWMRETELGVDRYIGVDIVDVMIERNQREFGNDRTEFQCVNLVDGDLPRADLILCRDCLVHLSFEDALRVLANFKRSGATFLLTTTFSRLDPNRELAGQDAFWRPLNLELPPFSFPSPLAVINEGCTEEAGRFTDKCLGLWRLDGIGPL